MLNDYKGLKLIASSNPHIRNNEDTRSIMLDVIIALCPALIMSVSRFGFRALISVLVSVVSAMFFEWLYRKLMHKTQTLGDLSAAVTGVLLAFVCPVTLPYLMLIVGHFSALFLVKQLYGPWQELPEPRAGRPCRARRVLHEPDDLLDRPGLRQGTALRRR